MRFGIPRRYKYRMTGGIASLSFRSQIFLVAFVGCTAFNAVAAESSSSAAPTVTTAAHPIGPSNPLLATYDGGQISLHKLEEFTREMPISQRIPFAKGAGAWRQYMSGELAKSTTLTSEAVKMGLHLDPGYLRARDYFTQEYMSYLLLRDKLTNVMDVSLEKQKQEYETHKQDYRLSPTVTLRVIRSRDADEISSAAATLKSGADFEQTELEYSHVSPRYRGRVLGPFPSRKVRSIIPPPDEVIKAAFALDPGETTGPITVRGYHFLVKTVSKTPGRQQSMEEVAEDLENSLRSRESAILVPALVDQIQKELGVAVDEDLFASGTDPNDLLATIGAQKIYRREYIEMNGNVRGPAAETAAGMPTKLKGFVLPYMFSEWAKLHGFLDREETKKALKYYDMQHLSANLSLALQEQIVPIPSDDKLRALFQQHIQEYREPGAPEPRFEDHRQDMISAIQQQNAAQAEHKITNVILSKIHFEMKPDPTCTNISALEALAAAGDQLSSGCRLLEIAPMRLPGGDNIPTEYEQIGRAPDWLIRYADHASSKSSELIVSGPQPLLQNESDLASIPAFRRWKGILQFDTDSLKRHAVDKGLGDFMAKYNNKVQAAAKVEFSYSEDDPTSPTESAIVYTATPLDSSVHDGFTLKYSGDRGEILKRRLGKDTGECLVCPKPDLPSPALLSSTTSGSTANTALSEKGDL